ncbi:ARPP-1 family domain-containing protein [Dactylosporangium darangshiense]|uniref:ARG and Rhodanese-Phosphatase-superfamily-associated domain-containing protein n=1 Tax=Dactylosporangium darangshiense TaxID=579108 RepID=A0ABP8CTH8_9ACTN
MNLMPALHLGAPTQAGPLTVFPIWTDAPIAPVAYRTSLPADARIDELDDPTVGRLRVTNAGTTPVLLLEGALLDGGWQHRVVTRSMFVDAQTREDVEVACVEQHRWSGGHGQQLARYRAPLAVRGALRGLRVEPLPTEAPDTGIDQGDVWQRVHRYERELGGSETSSLVQLQKRLDAELVHVLAAVRPMFGQRGVLIGAAGHPVLLEVFDDPQTLAEQWDALLSAVALDARLAPPKPTLGARARAFVQRVAAAPLRVADAAGEALAVHADDDLVSARGVATDDRLLHLAVLNAKHQFVLAA